MPAMTLPRTETRDVRSKAGRDYRIFILKPDGAPGPSGYPVLYLLDGNATFAIAAVSAALQARRPQATQVWPGVVVGIGYPVADYLDADRRTYDYTPPIDSAALPPRPDGTAWPPHGGASAFLDFIETELKPPLAAEFAIDRSRESIFGHSFGGLFVLHALLTRPHSFRSYIAASPSIWFARDMIHEQIGASALQGRTENGRRNLLVTVGSLERAASEPEPSGAGATADHRWRRQNRMVENAADAVERLSDACRTDLSVSFQEFDDENHSSTLCVSISRAVRMAFAPA